MNDICKSVLIPTDQLVVSVETQLQQEQEQEQQQQQQQQQQVQVNVALERPALSINCIYSVTTLISDYNNINRFTLNKFVPEPTSLSKLEKMLQDHNIYLSNSMYNKLCLYLSKASNEINKSLIRSDMEYYIRDLFNNYLIIDKSELLHVFKNYYNVISRNRIYSEYGHQIYPNTKEIDYSDKAKIIQVLCGKLIPLNEQISITKMKGFITYYPIIEIFEECYSMELISRKIIHIFNTNKTLTGLTNQQIAYILSVSPKLITKYNRTEIMNILGLD